MKVKEKALKLIKELNCTYEVIRAHYPHQEREINIFPPENKTIDGLSLGLVCRSWADVIERLKNVEIEKE